MTLPTPSIRTARWFSAVVLALTLGFAPLTGQAASPPQPVQVDLAGAVTSAQGAWASQLGSAFFASAVFGLDPAAGDATYVEPAGEAPYRVWRFSGSPYRAGVLGFDGALAIGQESFIEFETLDNLSLSGADNPFGLAGTFDVVALVLEEDNLDGTSTFVDIYFAHPDTSWFADGGLPTAIPALGAGGFMVLGQAWLYDSTDTPLGTVLMGFDAMEVTPVPEPAAVWMLLGGLLGVLGWARRSTLGARRQP